MLIISPDVVRFESHVWDDCTLITVDRSARKLVEDFSDLGPYPQFVDVPERAVHVRIIRRVNADETDDPTISSSGVLRFYLNTPGADVRRKRVEISCVLTSIRYEAPAAAHTQHATVIKTLTFAAFHAEAQDPVIISAADFKD